MDKFIICEHGTKIYYDNFINILNALIRLNCCNVCIEFSHSINLPEHKIYALNDIDYTYDNKLKRTIISTVTINLPSSIIGNAQEEFDFLIKVYKNLEFL